jgi:hypothetical protein
LADSIVELVLNGVELFILYNSQTDKKSKYRQQCTTTAQQHTLLIGDHTNKTLPVLNSRFFKREKRERKNAKKRERGKRK